MSFIGLGNTPLILEAIEESPNSRPSGVLVQGAGNLDEKMKDVGFSHMLQATMHHSPRQDDNAEPSAMMVDDEEDDGLP